MIKILFLTIVLGVSIPSHADIINIPADYPSIQQGIDISSNGDTILVQPGTYKENIIFSGHNIVLGSLFLTTRDTSYISSTIIDGGKAGRVVAFTDGEDKSAMICGFTISNGKARLAAGVYCFSSSPVIAYNIIKDNHSYF